MPEREQNRKTSAASSREEEVEEAPATSGEAGDKIKAELDDLLDEIDEVLETNAEDFGEVLHPEGRRVSRRLEPPADRSALTFVERPSLSLPTVTLPIFSPGRRTPGPTSPRWCVARAFSRGTPRPRGRPPHHHPRHHRAWPSATPTAW